MEPNFGDEVLVRPRLGLRVQSSAGSYGQFLPDEWSRRVFDEWLHRRLRDGSIEMRPVPVEPTEEK